MRYLSVIARYLYLKYPKLLDVHSTDITQFEDALIKIV
jgi:hypothetical protein